METERRKFNFGVISKKFLTKSSKELVQGVNDDFDPSTIDILDEYNEIVRLVEGGPNIIFVTGRAGTGKSTMIKYIKHKIQLSAVIAPTNIAAENVKGMTISSFFGLPNSIFNPEDLATKSKVKMPLLRGLKLLIVDEVSMVNAAVIDAMDIILRKANGSTLPFGGISILFVGDLFQLPPIVQDAEVNKYFSADEGQYDNVYFMSAKVFTNTTFEFTPIELTKVRRQNENEDAEFIEALNKIRIAGSDLQSYIDLLNTACYDDKRDDPFDNAITLAPSKSIVAETNQARMDEISNPAKSYNGTLYQLTAQDITGFQAPDVLELKVGARVLFVSNNKPRWINGDLVEVTELNEDTIVVKSMKTGINETVSRCEFKKYKYIYNISEGKMTITEKGSFEQFPLVQGWAITIHKSQGMTMEKVIVDIGGSAFADGQTYVALSRVKSLAGLKLQTKLSIQDIQVNIDIRNSYEELFGDSYSVH